MGLGKFCEWFFSPKRHAKSLPASGPVLAVANASFSFAHLDPPPGLNTAPSAISAPMVGSPTSGMVSPKTLALLVCICLH